MSTSPAWLTIALSALATARTPTPAAAFAAGIRHLPTTHILHHLNRWARHVWRPAVSARALSALTSAPTAEPLAALGAGAVALLAALADAIRRCDAAAWLDVLGVMFLADDPWTVEVGRDDSGPDADRAAAAMSKLYHTPALLADVAREHSKEPFNLPDDPPISNTSSHEGSFAELRCRIAALQLQLDDVTAVARRSEKHTKDLLSSFHFWSLLLLDELRGYRQDATGSSHGGSRAAREGAFDAFAQHMGQLNFAHGEGAAPSAPVRAAAVAPVETKNVAQLPPPVSAPRNSEPPRRVFRDGKWVTL